MKTLVLDPGHGGMDRGAQFKDIDEANIVLDIVLRLQRMLQASRYLKVFVTRTTDVYLTLKQRVEFANSKNADFFISVHTNADPDDDKVGMPEAKGEEIWIAQKGQGRQIAGPLAAAIMLEFPDEPWRGIKERDLYVVKYTNMPAALVETAFIDDSETNRKLHDPNVREEIAFALMRGILDL